MDIVKILGLKYTGCEWTLAGDDYKGLVWLSDAPKPSKSELEALWPEVEYESAYASVDEARKVAYRETSDPIFFEYQRGDATQKAWLDAVEAVKANFPYPEKS